MNTLPPLLLLAVASAGCASHIPDPGSLRLAGLEGATLAGQPSPELRVCWVEFATGTLPHRLVLAHGGLEEDVVSTQSGLLLMHPSGTWLIDGGMGADPQAQLRRVHGVPRLFIGQAARGWTRVASSAEAVRAHGVEPSSLAGAIPTHGHFDHLGGLIELSEVPVVLPQAEIDLAREIVDGGGHIMFPDEAEALLTRARALAWEGGPFLAWEQSQDLFGDGSVVLVAMPGHTPGSLGVHIRLADGRAIFLAGDTIWVREGYEQREPRAWLTSSFDWDDDQNDQQIARLWALHQAVPTLTILPAHDRRQWEAFFGSPGCPSSS